MNPPTGSERDFDQAKQLLEEYCFELSGFQAGELVAIWQERLEADPSWIRSAVLEALYQGRYKAFSVEQILQAWKRRGHPVRHFTSEFERVVFGPIDPTISKYAAMTTQRPSELMSAQSEPAGKQSSSTEPDGSPTDADLPLPPAMVVETTEASQPPSITTPPELPQLDRSIQLPSTEEQTSNPESDRASQPLSAQEPDPERNAPEPSAIFSQPEPIRKFVPQPEASEFYQRLQSVARHPL